jgi:hypothetical protein
MDTFATTSAAIADILPQFADVVSRFRNIDRVGTTLDCEILKD